MTSRGAGRLRAVLLALCAAAALAAPAAAKRCGDDVDGADVPCACGDEVVSSTRLDGDPVTRTICRHDGLIVRAADENASLLLDLAGHRLRGRGAGAGLRLLSGGPGGALILSDGGAAIIDGFDDGIIARGRDSVSLVEDVIVRDARRDGLRLTGRDFVVRRVVVEGARRDGFALGGTGFEIFDSRAEDSGRFGYFVMGDSGIVGGSGIGNVADRSGNAGFNLMGAGHTLADCQARGGRGDGVMLHATQLDVRGCRVSDNAGDGITGMGSRMRVADNQAVDNGGNGLLLRGPGTVDAGGNRGAGNRGDGRQREVVQCAIADVACGL